MAKDIVIRNARPEDYDFILKVNEVNVEVLSPMPMERMLWLKEMSDMFVVAEVNGELAAFLIAIREGQPYDSENYVWFSEKYPQFLYIDRIVIDEPFRAAGLGRALYQAVKDRAIETGVKVVTCEVDTIPYNETSLKFHEAMGFREVGEQIIRGGAIKVSLKACELE
ncbi:MAG: GNAT family N-acetyltransferase [Firmicutes bacterium]|jgi:predicted GNAT superfamily acetyltransferase|nr:GNAT family N-acetyltransferase [Bacillota bacterium]